VAANNADNRFLFLSVCHALVLMREQALGLCVLRSIQRDHLFDFGMDFTS
jgi:hypothetical protein